MTTVYSTGSWRPNTGRQEAFVESWTQCAAWASGIQGAGLALAAANPGTATIESNREER